LPIWAIEPWSDVAFHDAQISTVHGVILYPILGGVARCEGPMDDKRGLKERLFLFLFPLRKSVNFTGKVNGN
jgi:hypothetical protein